MTFSIIKSLYENNMSLCKDAVLRAKWHHVICNVVTYRVTRGEIKGLRLPNDYWWIENEEFVQVPLAAIKLASTKSQLN